MASTDESGQQHRNADSILFRLVQAADGLECGKQFQVARFYPVTCLCKGSAGYEFVIALLIRVRAEIVSSEESPLLPMAKKLKLLDDVAALFTSIPEDQRPNWQTIIRYRGAAMVERLHALQPGWKRLAQHATRRRARDKELLLTEKLLRGLLNEVLALFLTSYQDYRYHLLPDAAERVRWLVEFWCHHLFNETLEAFVERMRLSPPVKKTALSRPPSPWDQRMARGDALRVLERETLKERKGCSKPFGPIGISTQPRPAYRLGKKTIARLNYLEATLHTGENRQPHDDPVEEKLARAHYNLVKAWQICRDKGELEQIATRLKGAKNRCCEAWLYRNGHVPGNYDNRDSMASLFYVLGPTRLLHKAELLEEKLTGLLYRHIYTDRAYLGHEASQRSHRPEMAACLAETLAFYDHLRNATPLPLFRWEHNHKYVPGQTVLKLWSFLAGHDEQCRGISRWDTTPYEVVAVNEREMVVRRSFERHMERCLTNTLFFWPTATRTGVSSRVNRRRIWFDLRPSCDRFPCTCRNLRGSANPSIAPSILMRPFTIPAPAAAIRSICPAPPAPPWIVLSPRTTAGALSVVGMAVHRKKVILTLSVTPSTSAIGWRLRETTTVISAQFFARKTVRTISAINSASCNGSKGRYAPPLMPCEKNVTTANSFCCGGRRKLSGVSSGLSGITWTGLLNPL